MTQTREQAHENRERERLWLENPAAVTEAEHEQYCKGGYIDGDKNSYYQVDHFFVCPVCAMRKAQQKRHQETEAKIQHSGIGARYYALEWSDLEVIPPLDRIQKACDSIGDIVKEGHSALLWGGPGTGKTQSAVLAVKAAIRANYTAEMHNVGRLAMDIRQGYDDKSVFESDVVNRLSRVDLLVFDDVGAGETGEAKIEQRILYLILEARQNMKRATIMTTNLAPDEVTKRIGQRIMNRLQPLTQIHFNHQKNFRAPKDKKGLW